MKKMGLLEATTVDFCFWEQNQPGVIGLQPALADLAESSDSIQSRVS